MVNLLLGQLCKWTQRGSKEKRCATNSYRPPRIILRTQPFLQRKQKLKKQRNQKRLYFPKDSRILLKVNSVWKCANQSQTTARDYVSQTLRKRNSIQMPNHATFLHPRSLSMKLINLQLKPRLWQTITLDQSSSIHLQEDLTTKP